MYNLNYYAFNSSSTGIGSYPSSGGGGISNGFYGLTNLSFLT